jgi:hypothetical protein
MKRKYLIFVKLFYNACVTDFKNYSIETTIEILIICQVFSAQPMLAWLISKKKKTYWIETTTEDS